MKTKQQKTELIKSRYNWNDCICGGTEELRVNPNRRTSFHSPTCKTNHNNNRRTEYSTTIRRLQRQQRRENNECIYCAKSCEPIIIYHQACNCCREKYGYDKTKKKEANTNIVVQKLNE